MEIQKTHFIGIGIGLAVLGFSFFFINTAYFFLIVGIGIIIGILPFIIAIMQETKMALEKEAMFLEFSRNLVESVKTGTPVGKSIINVRNKPYGVLKKNVEKLANQIYLGVPLQMALRTFADDINNKTISRALTLIGQAEKSGGEIGEILEAVAEAVSTSDKLKKERKATISNLIVQGYIIFFVFMIIILVMQFKIIPMLSGIVDVGDAGADIGIGATTSGIDQDDMSSAFLYLLLVQGFFSGLTIGKLAEGNIKAGVKHSFALMLASFLVSAGANIILSQPEEVVSFILPLLLG